MIGDVVIIGSGNVGHHLGQMLQKAGLRIVQNYSKNMGHAQELAAKLGSTPISDLINVEEKAHLYLLALPDHVIADVVLKLPQLNGIVVHTSGSTPMDVLNKQEKYGVLYPLQTFKKGVKLTTEQSIPILIEANNTEGLQEIKTLTLQLTDQAHEMNSEGRKRIHLAAVMLNNFTNHTLHVVEDYVKQQKVNFEILKPLLDETFLKLQNTPPSVSQTGPAIRDDQNTIQSHLQMLQNHKIASDLYEFMTTNIQKLHKIS